ncbi:MAG: CDP-2,3-bis-(O-geranylgeranyl)-sn-glycerol synthase [Ignisphaera sp.]|nr:CDP-2,3-bis-(O-geranylgeranyl)-sn-glycerol synthase [Ignisphaera sp.]MCX8167974.1 CDP-2,3-bis-(O-geranylgeranyl)-sn-glycerol synthase [Ignisphaera sp.]MDW8085571.1 CDP-2,3-bis-(O-geranylgeranyl)-sn-glycerol synthase [Ignisphaera sp.]
MDLNTVLNPIWIILPAYIANGTPVVVAKILSLLGLSRHSIDFGRRLFDGKRVFGDNKSWEGFFAGLLTGILTGYIQYTLAGDEIYLYRGATLSFGALVGDLIGAFIKRRLGIEPGKPLPILDQLLFIITAIAIAQLLDYLKLSILERIYVLIVTLALHVVTNRIAYLLKLKDVPW